MPSANSNIEYGWTGGPLMLIGPDDNVAQVSSCFRHTVLQCLAVALELNLELSATIWSFQ